MAASRVPTTVHNATLDQPATNDRGRKNRSGAQKSSQNSSTSHIDHEPAMGLSLSKAVATIKSKSSSRSPSASEKTGTVTLDRDQLDRRASICQSPTWSPRGSLAARRQSDKDRREQQRQERREADEMKKRLKEEEQRQRTASSAGETSSHALRPGRRLRKQPPPAAMETQRMPSALQTAASQPDQHTRERRSSSLSSVIRRMTGSRSRSKSRGHESSDDEAYTSDASKRSSFIGGVKLKNAKATVGPRPQIDESAIRRDSVDFSAQMQAQMDSVTGRDTTGSTIQDHAIRSTDKTTGAAVGSTSPVGSDQKSSSNNDKTFKRVSTQGSTDVGLDTETESSPTGSKAKRTSSVRLASINRMQNLVIPLRSAMKGGRETAAAGRAQTLPNFSTHANQVASQSTPGDYVRRSRQRDNARSMAGWQDEMAVQKANEAASLQTGKQRSEMQGMVTQGVNSQAAYGPQMPPTPDASIDNLSRPSKTSDERSRRSFHVEPLASEPEKTPSSPNSPGDMDRVVWKQPIRANKLAAASRVEGQADSAATQKEEEEEKPLDIDALPSQQRRQFPLFPPQKPVQQQPVTAAVSIGTEASKLRPQEEGHMDSIEASGVSIVGAADHNLKRHPAVMSWKAEKDKNGKPFSASPQSPSSIASSAGRKVPPEQHPSLMALRSGTMSPDQTMQSGSNTQASHQDESADDRVDTLGASTSRPLSIVPTPVASPMPGDLITMAPADLAKPTAPVRRHSTPVEAIEQARTGAKENTSTAKATDFPFLDRHVTLRKPERRDTDMSDTAKQESDRENGGKGASGKVTFHTPPESPRYLAAPTSYDAYRRPYSTAKVSPSLGASEIDDDVELPVSVADLGKPNPPFAQRGKSPGQRSSRESSSSPRRSARKGSDGYVYLPFSPTASSSSINLEGKSRGFKLKTTDGKGNLDFAAKVFVICCGCRKWHDVPSALYKEMNKGVRDIDSQKDGVAEARLPTRGDEKSRSRDGRSKQPKRGGVLTTVPCCWCDHEMNTLCCEGWTTVCYKHVQHHPVQRDEEPAIKSSTASRPRSSKHHD